MMTMTKIVMTKGGIQHGNRPLSHVPLEKRNIASRCAKCHHGREIKDEYRRFFGWMCTIDKDMNAEGCDYYDVKER